MATSSALDDLAGVHGRSLREMVRDSIRDGILTGVLTPGTRLVEVGLARRFSVSQGTVREALRELEASGLLVTYRHRGTFVRNLSPDEVWETYTLRADLERMAVRLAVTHLGSAELAALRQLIDEMLEAAPGGDLDLLCRQDVEFHRYLVAAAHHGLLLRSWVATNPTIWTFLSMARLSNLSPLEMATRHEPILAALVAHDGAAAEAAIDEHILPLGAQVVERLREANDATLSPFTAEQEAIIP